MVSPLYIIRPPDEDYDLNEIYESYPGYFSILLYHGGAFTKFPGRTYVNGSKVYVDYIDSDQFSVHEIDSIMIELGHDGGKPMNYHFLEPKTELDFGLQDLGNDQDVSNLLSYVSQYKLIHVYTEPIRPVEPGQPDGGVCDEAFQSTGLNQLGVYDDLFNMDFEPFVDVSKQVELESNDRGNERVRVVCEGSIPNLKSFNFCGQSNNEVGPNKGTGSHDKDSNENKTSFNMAQRKEKNSNTDKGKAKVVDQGKTKVTDDKNNVNVNVGGRGKKGENFTYLCPWVLQVSKMKDSETWMVKTYKDEHKCLQSREIKACTYTYLSHKIVDRVESNPEIPVGAVQDQLQKELELGVSRTKAYRAKKAASIHVTGDFKEQYESLRDYLQELINTNPDTTVRLDVEPGHPNANTRVFKRVYVCLGALKKGFKALGRDLIGLDGAFMSGPFPSQLLTAVGIDSNNGIYPVAYAVVEAETLNSWTWFLECLGDDLDLQQNSNFTFVSDRQKGILPAIAKMYPCAEHRYCLKHIHENMKQGWKGRAYKDLLWKAATATTMPQFEQAMKELKELNHEAYKWLAKIPPQHWSKSHFSGRAISDVLLNNMCEVLNRRLVRGRDKPIISALEFTREYLMKRIVNVGKVIDKSDGPLTPTAMKMLESIKTEASKYTVVWNGGNKYQVSGPWADQCVVDIGAKTCSCRRWELVGMPCKHVVAVIWNMSLNGINVGVLESWAHPIYWLDTWKKVYSFKIDPVRGSNMWPKSTIPITLTPPFYHTPIGRPKKKRRKTVEEIENMKKGGKLTRMLRTVTCRKCGDAGHNSRGCKIQGRGENGNGGTSGSRSGNVHVNGSRNGSKVAKKKFADGAKQS